MNDQPGAASDHAIVVGAGVIGSAVAAGLLLALVGGN